jgi:hypothetical protein
MQKPQRFVWIARTATFFRNQYVDPNRFAKLLGVKIHLQKHFGSLLQKCVFFIIISRQTQQIKCCKTKHEKEARGYWETGQLNISHFVR